jgi:hypothetical protein
VAEEDIKPPPPVAEITIGCFFCFVKKKNQKNVLKSVGRLGFVSEFEIAGGVRYTGKDSRPEKSRVAK